MWSMDVWNDLAVFPTLILCVIVLWLTYMYVTWPYGYFKRHGIPGPPPLPVIGNWKDITKKVFHDLDIEFIEKYGKVVGNYNGWLPELIVADVDLVKQFTVKQASEFIDRRPLHLRGTLQNSVLDTTGEEWRRQRSLISPFFSSGKLKQNAKRISRILSNMERSLSEMCQSEQEINGKDFAISITTDVICSVGFGIEVESLKQPDHPMVKDLAAVIRDFGPGNPWFILTVLSPTICKVLDYFNVSMFRGNAFKNIEQIVTELIKKKKVPTATLR